jgi:hypothetical protein
LFKTIAQRVEEGGRRAQTPRLMCDVDGPVRISRTPVALAADPAFFAHWEPRARGVRRFAQPGWFFSGRTRVLRELVGWLGGDGAPGTRLVTGNPGCGKSAVLARIVSLAEPEYEIPEHVLGAAPAGTVPEPGSIDVAIHAGRKKTRAIARQISTVLGLSAGDHPGSVIDELFARRDAVLVIDALDEADDPADLVQHLVGPLVAEGWQYGIRLLLASRRPLHGALSGVPVIDLDQEELGEDVEAYVKALLVGPETSPYVGKPIHTDLAGRAVAQTADGNFLLAQLVAASLTLPDEPAASAELARFPGTVGLAMDRLLTEIAAAMHRRKVGFGADPGASPEAVKRWLTDLLIPLAFVRGAGMADEALWAGVASAIGVRRYDEHDVRKLRGSPAGALLRDSQDPDGDVAWALFHQALVEELAKPGELAKLVGGGARTVHGAFVDALVSPSREWRTADRYTLSYLAWHARHAGRADELATDPEFLVYADPAALVPMLESCRSAEGRKTGQLVRAGMAGDPGARRRLLALNAMRYDEPRLAAQLADPPGGGESLRWRVRWATGSRSGNRGTSYYSACGEVDGEPVLVTAGVDQDNDGAPGVPMVWRLATGGLLRELPGHDARLWGVAYGRVDGADLAVTVSDDWTARVWDLATGECRQVLEEHLGEIHRVTCTTVDGRPAVITGSADFTALVWDLDSGRCGTP